MASSSTTVKLAKQKIIIDGNLEMHGDFALLALNPQIFPLSLIYAASSPLLEQAYFVVDGDPSEEIVVELRPKDGTELQLVGRELGNQLIKELEKHHQKIILASEASSQEQPQQSERQSAQEDQPPQELSYKDDPLGIMKPWSEKE